MDVPPAFYPKPSLSRILSRGLIACIKLYQYCLSPLYLDHAASTQAVPAMRWRLYKGMT